ncbi:MAG: translation elongation factor Ts [Verrucomicrobia bacterium GWF2_51_19]|nr:MAG: translation elongation factor Ts [Verrucomicrobia bacterium GWF2_51_19]HCJ12396.1 translation elongation factor Ts [Opitutae bacterium]
MISANAVGELRARTGAGLMDCKKALVESDGNMDEAITILKKKGIASAAKKAGREASEGIVESYIHLGGRVGVLLELNCETDFVAKNDAFKQLARDLCMQVAAASPLYVKQEDVPADMIAKEKEVAVAQAAGKPPAAVEKIVEGKLSKWFAQVCLVDQPFVKNQDQTVRDLLSASVAKLGENIVVGRFVRYQIGE